MAQAAHEAICGPQTHNACIAREET
jgi:hypothetical protein